MRERERGWVLKVYRDLELRECKVVWPESVKEMEKILDFWENVFTLLNLTKRSRFA